MTDQTLPEALSLTRNGEALSARLTGGFSNGPQGGPPEAGAPFGGLLAALAAKAMREGLDLTPPLRSLSVQYLAAARFERECRYLAITSLPVPLSPVMSTVLFVLAIFSICR